MEKIQEIQNKVERQNNAIVRKYAWFNRMIIFSGHDNLETIINRLQHFFPDEEVPNADWFIETCREYLANPDIFLQGEEEDPNQYADLWDEHSPFIDEINAFINVKEPKTLLMFSRAFNVYMYELIKDPSNPDFKRWFKGFIKKAGHTVREAQAEKRRRDTILFEEHRIANEIDLAALDIR